MKISIVTALLLFSLFAGILPSAGQAGQKNILIVVTTASSTINGKRTGIWLEEYTIPYELFTQAGFAVTVASPTGGKAFIDPGSMKDGIKEEWKESIALLDSTKSIEGLSSEKFDAIFFPGGHGTMFDLPGNKDIGRLLAEFEKDGKVIAAVCHGPAAFIGAKKHDGSPLIAGKTITGFTNAEESAAKMVTEVPFALETALRKVGANVIIGEMWASHIEIDGHLVTGQNPASSEATAKAIIGILAN